MPTLRARDDCIPKADRINSRQAGDARQKLLVVAVQVEVLVAARPGIQADFEHPLFLETEVEGTQTLEAADEEACSK